MNVIVSRLFRRIDMKSIILNVISFNISQNPFLLSRYSRIIDLVIFVFDIEQFKNGLLCYHNIQITYKNHLFLY